MEKFNNLNNYIIVKNNKIEIFINVFDKKNIFSYLDALNTLIKSSLFKNYLFNIYAINKYNDIFLFGNDEKIISKDISFNNKNYYQFKIKNNYLILLNYYDMFNLNKCYELLSEKNQIIKLKMIVIIK